MELVPFLGLVIIIGGVLTVLVAIVSWILSSTK